MVILGLGTNQGDRLHNLRNALQAIRKIPQLSIQQISPLYISDALLPENAPAEWNAAYLNMALRCDTTLTPEELLRLTKNIETELGRQVVGHWGPRVIDIDILAWDDLIKYDDKLHIPHKNLHERPFALWPLADVAPRWVYPFPGPFQGKTAAEISLQWGSRFSGKAPLRTKQISHRIDTPQLMGILNVTPDSFSDGGKYFDIFSAIQHARDLVEAGAEILDIGAESTGPDAMPLNSIIEWERLEPVLSLLMAEIARMPIPPKISVDTRHADVAKKALNLGVDWINDVSGLENKAMRDVMAQYTCPVIFMHHLTIPEERSLSLPLDQNPTQLVFDWAKNKIQMLENSGIARERLIFDIGIGYGKTAEQSLELLKNIPQFQELGVRLLVGHSRKSFLQQFTVLAPHERDLETLVLSLHLANQKVDYLRVHNVSAHARAYKVATTLSLP